MSSASGRPNALATRGRPPVERVSSPVGTGKSARMNRNKAFREKGDFSRIAQSMRKSGEAVIASLDVGPKLKAHDLGCGDGTTALPAAHRGADVLGVHIARNLVEAG